MSNLSRVAENFRERFHQAYNELLESGFSVEESAARAILVAGGQEPASREGTQQSEGVSALETSSDPPRVPTPHPEGLIVADDNDDEYDGALLSEQSSEASLGTVTAAPKVTFFGEALDYGGTDFSPMDLITTERIRELIQSGRNCNNNFRELVRFLGRTMSSPECVSVSFAPVDTGAGDMEPNDDTVVDEVSCEQIPSPGAMSSTGGEEEQKSAMLVEEKRGGDDVKEAGGSGEGKRQVPDAKSVARADRARAGEGAMVCSASTDAAKNDRDCGRSDRGVPGVDIAAASQVWRMLRELDMETVSSAVLTALETLAQSLLVERLRPHSSGVARSNAELASIRALVIVLEHPEAQDPDFERILVNLFKLAMSFAAEAREGLCKFMAKLEEERFSR